MFARYLDSDNKVFYPAIYKSCFGDLVLVTGISHSTGEKAIQLVNYQSLIDGVQWSMSLDEFTGNSPQDMCSLTQGKRFELVQTVYDTSSVLRNLPDTTIQNELKERNYDFIKPYNIIRDEYWVSTVNGDTITRTIKIFSTYDEAAEYLLIHPNFAGEPLKIIRTVSIIED